MTTLLGNFPSKVRRLFFPFEDDGALRAGGKRIAGN